MEQIRMVNKQAIDINGARYYDKLREQLEASAKGKIVAINPDNGDHFVADSVIEAVRMGRQRYPECVFYSARIGYPVVYRFH
jgi:hypothetical protein